MTLVFLCCTDILAKLDREIKNLDVHTRPEQCYPGEKIYEIFDKVYKQVFLLSKIAKTRLQLKVLWQPAKAQINYNTFPGLKILMEEAANRVLSGKPIKCSLNIR